MMADFSRKEYWIYQEIEEEFRKSVNPFFLVDHIKECLTEDVVLRFRMRHEGVRLNNFSKMISITEN